MFAHILMGSAANIYRCDHCNHENKNLEKDEDGDLVCQECGHAIQEDTLAIREI